jgi:hypothetical protein
LSEIRTQQTQTAFVSNGGEGGIRTHGKLAPPPVFKALFHHLLQLVTKHRDKLTVTFSEYVFCARLSKFVTICARVSHQCPIEPFAGQLVRMPNLRFVSNNSAHVRGWCVMREIRVECLALRWWLLGVINQRGVIAHRFHLGSEHAHLVIGKYGLARQYPEVTA